MVKRNILRTLALLLAVLAMVVIAGCGGGGDGEEGTTVASLTQGRWGHTATMLGDGRVLVAGGQESSTVALSTAEIYNPSTKTWSSASTMKEAHGEGHTATRLKDGRVLVVGGGNSTEIYDPPTGTWSATGSMSGGRLWHTATLLEDGRVLVTGGLDPADDRELDTAEVYDPSTGQWSPTGAMAKNHSRHIAALLPDGKVLVMAKTTAETYDPSTGTWSRTADPPQARDVGHTSVLLEDGRVLIAGGQVWKGVDFGGGGVMVSLKYVDIYNPSTGAWSMASSMVEGPRIAVATRLEDGSVLVVGHLAAEVYDPTKNTWVSAGQMKVARTDGHTATLLGDGTVLVVGGRKGAELGVDGLRVGGQSLNAVEIYDPATGW